MFNISKSVNSLLQREKTPINPNDSYQIPEIIHIDGEIFERSSNEGNYKKLYENGSEIAIIPNPVYGTFSWDTQLEVCLHNQEIYEKNGLETVTDFEKSHAYVRGEEKPVLKGEYVEDLEPINKIEDHLKEDEIIEYIVELDRLKRQGEISTAESVVPWENILEETEILVRRPVTVNGETLEDYSTLNFGERPYSSEGREGDHIIQEFLDALWNNKKLEPEKTKDKVSLNETLDPQEIIREQGIPQQPPHGLPGTLSYKPRQDSIVISDIGEYTPEIFQQDKTPFNSGKEFLKHHNITK